VQARLCLFCTFLLHLLRVVCPFCAALFVLSLFSKSINCKMFETFSINCVCSYEQLMLHKITGSGLKAVGAVFSPASGAGRERRKRTCPKPARHWATAPEMPKLSWKCRPPPPPQ
jgi:hypothetical protein